MHQLYNQNCSTINEADDMFDLDADLISAIMYMVETHGYYDQIAPITETVPATRPFGGIIDGISKLNKLNQEPVSLLPMNVNVTA